MANTSNTILVVPGAWHSPLCFVAVGTKLQEAGYKVRYVTLPSCGPKEHLTSMTPDVEKIKQAITEEADAGQSIHIVCHSYGGIPSSVAVQDLDLASRRAKNLPGGVAQLFFGCSFIVPKGKSLIQAFGGSDLPWFDVSSDKSAVDAMDSKNIFYNDMVDDQVEAAIAHLKPHSYQTFHSPVTYAGWKHVPTTYMYCLKDQAIPMFVQKMMVEEWAKDVPVKTQTVDASHSLFFSMPEETAQAMINAVKEVA